MKRSMKIISALALAFVLSTTAYAQETISATATVLDAITFGTHQNLAFGDVIAGQSSTIGANEAGSGYFTITGYENTKDFSVSVAESGVSFGGGGVVTLTLEDLNYQFAVSPDATSSTDVTGGTVDLASQTSTLYLFVGGTIDASGATSGGAYSSTITLSIEYL